MLIVYLASALFVLSFALCLYFKNKLERVKKLNLDQAAILSSMSEGIIAISELNIILLINEPAKSLLQVSVVNPIGKSLLEICQDREILQFVEGLSLIREAQKIIEREDGSVIEIYSRVLLDSDSKSNKGLIIGLRDVSELRHLERVRRDFVANVSHELKTPITSIKGFVETLIDGAAEDQTNLTKFLSIISKHADRLNSIINDLLFLARLEHEESISSLEFSDVALDSMLVQSQEYFEDVVKQKNLSVIVRVDPTIKIRCEAGLLGQAINNLVENAIKYSDPLDTITLSGKESFDSVIISVQDSGTGISPEHLDRLFERFYRVDQGRSRRMGGTGLGLAIVKHVVQVHGGKVTVESQLGVGSTFLMELPKQR